MKTIKVLIVANDCNWQSWPDKVAYLKAFFAPVATLQIDLIQTSIANVPFVHFTPGFSTFELFDGQVMQVDPAWYAQNITPLAKGYDVSLLVLPLGEWPILDCVRGLTTYVTVGPIPCEIGADENEGVFVNGIKLFETAEHYAAHELAHALFSLAKIDPNKDTTHYWDFAQHNLAGVLSDIKFNPMPQAQDPDFLYPDWSVQKQAYHNVRALCDLAGLSLVPTVQVNGTMHTPKDIICACIYQESRFMPSAVGKPNSNGTIDYGICQFNNGSLRGVPLWIGAGAAFPSTEYVLSNPEECVKEMIEMYQAGHINWWSSYSTGAYKQWLEANSPMWQLAH